MSRESHYHTVCCCLVLYLQVLQISMFVLVNWVRLLVCFYIGPVELC